MLGSIAFRTRPSLRSAVPFLVSLNGVNLVMGLGLNMLLAATFGAGPVKDGLDASLAIPRQLVIALGLGSLGGGALYVLARLGDVGERRSSRFVWGVFWLQTVYSAVVVAVLYWADDWFVGVMSPGMEPDARRLLLLALRWTAWICVLQPLIDLFGSVNTARQLYGTAQMGGMLQKGGAIVGVVAVSWLGAMAYPAGVVFGYVAAVSLVVVVGLRAPIRFTRPMYRTTEFRDAFQLSVPWIVMAPLLNLAGVALIPLLIAMGPGAFASYTYANTLYTMMLTILVIPLMDALAPLLARDAIRAEAGGDCDAPVGQSVYEQGLRLSLIVGVTTASFLAVSSRWLVGALYYHGAMEGEDVRRIALFLALMAFSFVGQVVTVFFGRLFQARIAILRYIASQAVAPVILLGIVLLLRDRMGIYSVAVGMIVSTSVAALLGFFMAGGRRSHLGSDWGVPLWSILLLAVGSLGFLFSFETHPSLSRNAFLLLVSSFALGAVAWGAGRALGLTEIDEIERAVLATFSRRR